MAANSDRSRTFSRQRRHLRLAGLLIVLLLIPVLFAPQIIEYVLPWYLQRQGLVLSMSSVEVDLPQQQILLSDMRVGTGTGLAVRFQKFGAQVDLRALLNGEFPLEDVQLHGGELDLEALRSGAESEGNGVGGTIKIPEILIQDLKLKRISKSLQRDVVIKRLYLKGLAAPAQPQQQQGDAFTTQRMRSRIELQAMIGNASLNLEGELGLHGEVVNVDVNLQLDKLKLAGLQRLLEERHKPDFAGLLFANTRLKLRYDPNGDRLASTLSGTLNTEAFKFQNASVKVQLTAMYKGDLEIDSVFNASGSTKLIANGLLSGPELNLQRIGAAQTQGSLHLIDYRYEGRLVQSDTLLAQGKLQLAHAELALGEAGRTVSMQGAQAAISYQESSASMPRVALSDVGIKQFQFVSATVGGSKIKGQGIAAAKVDLSRDLEVDAQTLAVAALAYQGIDAGSPTIRLARLKLNRLSVDQSDHASLKQLQMQQFEVLRAGQTLRGQGLSVAALKKTTNNRYALTQLGVASLQGDVGGEFKAAGLRASNLNVDTGKALSSAKIALQDLKVDLPGEDLVLQTAAVKAFRYAFDGGLVADEFSAARLQHRQSDGVQTTVQKLLSKKLQLNFASGIYQLGSIAATALSSRQNNPPARLDSGALAIRGLNFNTPSTLAIETLEVADLKIGAAEPPQMVLPSLLVSTLNVDPNEGLRLAEVRLSSPAIALMVDAGGHFNMPGVPFTAASGRTPEPRPDVFIGKLSTQGKPDFRVTDKSVEPAYRLKVKPFSLVMEKFSTRPDSVAGSYTLSAQTGTFTHLDFSGTTQARAAGMDIGLAGRLTGMELKPLSPYTGKYNQFAIRNGSGDLTLSGYIKSGKLDLKAKMLISKLEVEPFYQGRAENPEAADGSGSFAAALMLLSDSKQVVRLKVPVTGTLAAPEFDFSDATTRAVTGVAKNAAMLALQPLKILMTAVKLAKNLGKDAVETIRFSPAEAKLGAQSITLLDTLADRLKGTPKLRLRVCGRVVAADTEAWMKKKLPSMTTARQDLAQSRAQVVRDYLEQKQLVEAAQLVMGCTSEADESAKAKPRTELTYMIQDKAQPPSAGAVSPPTN